MKIKAEMKQLLDAINKNDFLTVSLLIEKGVDINEIYNAHDATPMLYATGGHGNVDMMTLLIELGGDIHHIDSDGQGSVYAAATTGNLSRLRTVLDTGANPNVITRFGYTPLKHLIDITRTNNTLVPHIKLLLEKGANPNVLVKEGSTALGLALITKNEEVIKLLIEYGADPMLEKNSSTVIRDLKLHYDIDYPEKSEVLENSYEMER